LLPPLIRKFAYNDLENKIEVHKLAYKYYLSLPLPERLTKREDANSLIEAQYHACMSKEYDKALSIIYDYKLDQYLDMWGNYKTLVEIYNGVLPKDHFRDKPLLNSIQAHSTVLGNLGSVYRNLGDIRKAIEYYEKALQIAKEIGDRKSESMWIGYIGGVYFDLDDAKKAIEYNKKALKIAQEVGDRKNECEWFENIGSAYHVQGDVRKALKYYEKALKIAQEIGERREECTLLANLGSAYNDMGDARKAIDYYEKALKIAQEIGERLIESQSLGDLGLTYSNLGDVKSAIEFYEKALKIAQEIGDIEGEGTWIGYLGSAYYDKGDMKNAVECNEEAFACYFLAEDMLTEEPELVKLEFNLQNLKKELGEKEFEKLAASVKPRAEDILLKIIGKTSTCSNV